MQETQIWSLGQEDPLAKGTATDSNTLAWKIPWTEEPGGQWSVGSQGSDTTWWLNYHIYSGFYFPEQTLSDIDFNMRIEAVLKQTLKICTLDFGKKTFIRGCKNHKLYSVVIQHLVKLHIRQCTLMNLPPWARKLWCRDLKVWASCYERCNIIWPV